MLTLTRAAPLSGVSAGRSAAVELREQWRLVLGGMACTALLGIAGVGTGAVPKRGSKDVIANALHLTWLRGSPTTRGVCLALVFLAMAGLLTCWWRLRQRLPVLSPAAVLLVAAAWGAPLLLSPPLFSADVYAYAGQGHLVSNHIDPYTYGPGDYEPTSKWSFNVDGIWRFSPAPYGPVWLWLSGKVVFLAHDHLIVALFLFRLLALAGLALIAVALPRIARSYGVAPQQALWLGLANPLVLLHGIAGAHNDLLMVGLVALGFAVAGRHPTGTRLALAAALITVAALVKLPALAALGFLPFLATSKVLRVRAAAVVTTTSLAVAAGLTAVTHLGWGWLGVVGDSPTQRSVWSGLTGIGLLLGNGLHTLGIVAAPDSVLNGLLSAGLYLTALAGLSLVVRAHALGPVRAFGLLMLAVIALSPAVQPWYLLWGLVLLAAAAGPRTRSLLAALSVVLCLCLCPGGRSWVRPPLYGAPITAAVALAALIVRRDASRVVRARGVLV